MATTSTLTHPDDMKNELSSALLTLMGDDFFGPGGASAIVYGSRREDSDIDLMIVSPKSEVCLPVQLGKADLLLIESNLLQYELSVLDPTFSAPFLSGELLLGDESWWQWNRARLSSATAMPQAVHHATEPSTECLTYTNQYLSQLEHLSHRGPAEMCEGGQTILASALRNLSFSISYASFAAHYSRPASKACLLHDLEREGALHLPEFWAFYRAMKNTRSLREADVRSWVSTWNHLRAEGETTAATQLFVLNQVKCTA